MIPWRRPNELLHDQTLDIDQCRNLLGILPVQVRQQACQVEVHIAFAGLGFQTLLIGRHEVAQTVHHVVEHVRGKRALQNRCPADQG